MDPSSGDRGEAVPTHLHRRQFAHKTSSAADDFKGTGPARRSMRPGILMRRVWMHWAEWRFSGMPNLAEGKR